MNRIYNNENQKGSQLCNGVSRPNSLKLGSTMTPSIFSPRNTALVELNSPDFRGLSGLNTPAGQFLVSPEIANFFQLSGSGLSPLTPMSFLNPPMVSTDEDMFANTFTKKLDQIKQEKDGFQERVLEDTHITDISYSGGAYNYSQDDQGIDSHQSEDMTYSFSANSAYMERAPSSSNSSQPPNGPSVNSFGSVKYDGPSSVCSSSTDITSSVADNKPKGLHTVKLERKRARNRDAARKCRERKLELISQLQKQVSSLSDNNKTLQVKVKNYQSEVERLKKFVLDHVQNGCTLR